MNEAIQAIIEAARGDRAEQLVEALLDRERKQAADKAAGVDDTAGELRRALQRQKDKVAELRPYAELGTLDDIRTQLAEVEKLKQQLESQEHGVDDAKVTELAEQRAAKMSEAAVRDAKDEAARIQSELDKALADREHLIGRLETAFLDLDLKANGGGEVNPLFYPLLRENARKHYKIVTNGEKEWWRGENPPRYAVVDPKDGETRLTGKDGPMTTAELLAKQRLGDWADFWPRKDRGPGGETVTTATSTRTKLDPLQTDGVTLLDNALGSL